MMTHSTQPLLAVRDLRVERHGGHAPLSILHGVNLEIAAGEIVGLVGESGSGKTMTALAALQLLPPTMRISAGSLSFAGQELRSLDQRQLQALRGGQIAMIFQDALRHLNPAFTIGDQLTTIIRTHDRGLSGRVARRRAVELLAQVQITEPERRLRAYPHQLSGGMAQRVMIAMAISGSPRLLLADEPTAALDVTVQAEILRLLRGIARERGMAILFISHNIGAVWQLCDRVCVMYAGQVVEEVPVDSLAHSSAHPYTRALMGAVPQLRLEQPALASIPGQLPALGERSQGCAFHPRCAHAQSQCGSVAPHMVALAATHQARCLYAGQLPAPQEARP